MTGWSNDGSFSVKLTFLRLQYLTYASSSTLSELSTTLRRLSKSNFPSNIQIFAWKHLLNCLQTKDELAKKWNHLGVSQPRLLFVPRPERNFPLSILLLFEVSSSLEKYYGLDWSWKD